MIEPSGVVFLGAPVETGHRTGAGGPNVGRMTRTLAVAVVFVMTVAACGGSSDDDGAATSSTTTETTTVGTTVAATTTTEATTTTTTTTLAVEPEAELSREARTAITRCIDSITITGAIMRDYAVEFADASQLEATRDLCDEASLQVKVDNTGPVGPTTLNRLAYQISTISLAANLAILSLLSGDPDFITVGNFDTPIDEAVAEIAELLD